MSALWKKGRGKLGPLAPLIGSWIAESDSPMGPLRCTRRLTPALGGKYLLLDVHWQFGPGAGGKSYEEQMPAGLARRVYWPADDGGFHWAVESKTKKGWNRFVDHHYRPADAPAAP